MTVRPFSSYFTLLSVLILFYVSIGCTDNSKERATSTYLGGEIVNPKGDSVSIYKDGERIASVKLDKDNRFLHDFGESFESGLYRFYHGENQLAFIEEGDSLLFRINTLQFDESLSFSGFGEAKNNLLIDLYLMYEQENKILPELFQREPEPFVSALDSMLALRMERMDRFHSKQETSEAFDKIAQSNVIFDNYQRRESYPFSHYGRRKMEFIQNLPDDFYRFRESVSLNDEDLYSSYSYLRYLIYHLDHLAYLKYAAEKPYNSISYIHNKHELDLIDSLITSPKIKDRLIHRVARNFMANSNNAAEVKLIYERSKDFVVSESTRENITELFKNYEYTAAGQPIPELMLVDAEGRIKTFKTIINKPTVLYFWSLSNMSQMDDIHLKTKELKGKYPEYDFIGININRDTEKWRKVVAQRHFDSSKEFQFKDRLEGMQRLSTQAANKAIILSSDGTVLNSHANLYSTSFENDLLGYLNK